MTVIRLLVVDDAAQVRQGLRTLLPLAAEAAGLELKILGEASSGREAIEQVMALSPDVVLMDIEMPEMDGCVATQAIKALCPAVRVVALSVHGAPAVRQQAQDAGVDAFIEKGAPLHQVLQAIRAGEPADAREG